MLTAASPNLCNTLHAVQPEDADSFVIVTDKQTWLSCTHMFSDYPLSEALQIGSNVQAIEASGLLQQLAVAAIIS